MKLSKDSGDGAGPSFSPSSMRESGAGGEQWPWLSLLSACCRESVDRWRRVLQREESYRILKGSFPAFVEEKVISFHVQPFSHVQYTQNVFSPSCLHCLGCSYAHGHVSWVCFLVETRGNGQSTHHQHSSLSSLSAIQLGSHAIKGMLKPMVSSATNCLTCAQLPSTAPA